MDCSTPGFLILYHLPEFAQVHVHQINNAIQPSYPLSLTSSPALSVSQHQGYFFSSESALCIRWSKYWSFSISHSDEYSGLISFRIDWFDLLKVQSTLKILLQHHSSKTPILLPSAFYMVQLSHLYMTTWKDHALTIRTFVGKVCLCFLTHCLGLS